jgi:Ca-activated chloride channel family protein
MEGEKKASANDDQPEVGETVMKNEDQEPEKSPNVLVVLTDGENHEGHAQAMAAEAHKLGMGIYIIGLGSREGATIPIEKNGRETTLKYKGEDVITRLEDQSLRNVLDGLPSRAGYLSAAKANVNLMDIYRRVISKQGKQEQKYRYTIWQEKFQLFVGIGMALVMLAGLIREQKPMRNAEGVH